MIAATHTKHSPWAIVKSNDKRRAHLALIRHILLKVDYAGRDMKAIGEVDEKILGPGPTALEGERSETRAKTSHGGDDSGDGKKERAGHRPANLLRRFFGRKGSP